MNRRLVILVIIVVSALSLILSWQTSPDLDKQDYRFRLGTEGNGGIYHPHLDFFIENKTVVMTYIYTGNKTEDIDISIPFNSTLKHYQISSISGKNLTNGTDFKIFQYQMEDKNQYVFTSFKDTVSGRAEFTFEDNVIPNGLFIWEIEPWIKNADDRYRIGDQVLEGPEIMRFHLLNKGLIPRWGNYQLINMWNIRNTKLISLNQRGETTIYVNYNPDHEHSAEYQVMFVLNSFDKGLERLKEVLLGLSLTLFGYVFGSWLEHLLQEKYTKKLRRI